MVRALFIGRFQPFHKGHLNAIRFIKNNCDELIIIIAEHKIDRNNPFSVSVRKKMIRLAGVSDRISVVKDIPSDYMWAEFIVKKFNPALIFSNNPWTLKCFKGFNVIVKRIPVKYKIHATVIRSLIKNKKEYKTHIPSRSVKIVEKYVSNKANSGRF